MPSLSLQAWFAERSALLDDIEHARRTVRGTGSGARAANQQINQAMMNPNMQIPHKTQGKFRVGDRVRILYGHRGLIGEVVEDRGNIGIKGMRIYGVTAKVDEWNDHTSEYPEESLEMVEAADLGNGKRA